MKDPWKHRSDGMKCKTCMWFIPKKATKLLVVDPITVSEDGKIVQEHENTFSKPSETYDLGRCKKHAPTMNGYPVVFVNDWCGDHKLDENKI